MSELSKWRFCFCWFVTAVLSSFVSVGFSQDDLRPSLMDILPDRLEASRANYYRTLYSQMQSHGTGNYSPNYVINTLKLWNPGQAIRVAFNGGSSSVREKIADVASTWTSYANISFDFKDSDGNFNEWSTSDTEYRADIRISFDNPGYYSMLGTDSISAISANMESMNFGGFDSTLPREWEATVLHEFGHALGFEHEHQHPEEGCESEFRWDDDLGYVATKDSSGCWYVMDSAGRRPGIYTVLGGCPNYWDKAKVDFNLRQLPPSSAYSLSAFDSASIMKYYFDAWMFKSGTSSPCYSPRNLVLSAQDKLGAATVYPRPTEDVRSLVRNRVRVYSMMANTSHLASPVRRMAAMQARSSPELAQALSALGTSGPPPQQTVSQPSNFGASQVIPRFHADLLSPNDSPMMDLSSASGVAFNVVDGGYEAPPSTPWKLFRGNATDVWFFAPSLGKLATRPDGSPAMTLTAKVRNNPDGSRTWVGGTLSFLIQVTQEIPSQDVMQGWHDLLKAQGLVPRGASFQFQPLPLTQGKLNAHGLAGKVVPGGQPTNDVSIGASSAIAFALNLTGDTARDYYVAMKSRSQIPPQVAIVCSFKYQKLLPSCRIRMSGSKKKTYDYFSDSLKARASYWGLVSGSFERSRVRAELKNTGGFNLEVIGTPPAGIDIAKLTDAMTDKFLMKEAGEWIKPDPTPAEASSPGGFFGGVSYSMKSVNISAEESFSGEINVADLIMEPHDISFDFETAMSQLDPEKHAFLIEDDRQLDLKLVVGNCPLVLQSTSVASYVRGGSPIRVAVPDLPSAGGITSGIMQWTQGLEEKPTSADMESAFIFQSPYPSYIVKRSIPVSDSGAVLAIFPDNFVQRSTLIFTFDGSSADNVAICQWKFTPPPGSTSLPVSRVIRIGGDPIPGNLPTTDIVFPLKEEDVLNGGKIELKVKGLRGQWAGKETPTIKLDLGQSSLAIDWDGELKL